MITVNCIIVLFLMSIYFLNIAIVTSNIANGALQQKEICSWGLIKYI